MHRSISLKLIPILKHTAHQRGAIFGVILVCALLAFEVFNFSTTAFALGDVLGNLSFAGLQWATILAVAFCGIDFAGIARIFTPEQGRDEPAELWYLFGAWLLAASFNAILTWWGVSVAILNHTAAGGALIGQSLLTRMVPVFVAGMVWLIRVLIIGTFSIAGERLFTLADASGRTNYPSRVSAPLSSLPRAAAHASNLPSAAFARPAPKPVSSLGRAVISPEPTYQPVSLSAMPADKSDQLRN